MIRIRGVQKEAIARARVQTFKASLRSFIVEAFPDQATVMGETGVSAAADLAVSRAAGYGLSSQRDLCGYLSLMFQYGRDFDTDPDLPFADRILQCRMVYERQPSIDHLLGAEEKVPPDFEELGYAHTHIGTAE